MSFDLDAIVRSNIRGLQPYSSARTEFTGTAEVVLDANENAFGSPAGAGLNRYPDPLQMELRRAVAEHRFVRPEQVFVGNGSDEAIDLMYRIFCEPGRDEAVILPPTYGMYKVSAQINDVSLRTASLTENFQIDETAVSDAVTSRTKLIFICSPNNPTGNLMDRESVLRIAAAFAGLVVIDEAYIDFADARSMVSDLAEHPNLVILQTFSKAWGMAGLRVGLAFANESVIELMNRVKPPYNVNAASQAAVLKAINASTDVEVWKAEVVRECRRVANGFAGFSFVKEVFPSDANFILTRVDDAGELYRYLLDHSIVVRDRSREPNCDGCLRVTIGTPDENDRLLRTLTAFEELERTKV